MGDKLAADGTLNWLADKQQPQNIIDIIESDSTTDINGLFACDLKTNVLGQSVKIETVNGVLFHLPLDSITSYDIVFNRLKINTADEVPFTLTFVDNVDALTAATNLDIAMNGGYINCIDSIITYNYTITDLQGGAVTYPLLIFIDGEVVGRAKDEDDLLTIINTAGQPYYFITFTSPTEFTLSTFKKYLANLPISFQSISTFFGGQFQGTQLNLEIDYPATSDFWVYNSGDDTIQNNSPFVNISFLNEAIKTFEVYYKDSFLQSLNLSNSNLMFLYGTLPSQLQDITIENSLIESIDFIDQVLELKSLVIRVAPLLKIVSANLNLLAQLGTMIFENCNFTSFPDVIDNLLALQSVTVRNTPVTALPVFINSSALYSLFFENCDLSTFDAVTPSVKSFSVIGLNITSFTFPSPIAIEQINLMNGQLSSLDLSLSMNDRLNNINLSNNKLDISSAIVISFLTQLFASNSYNGYLDLTLNQGSIVQDFLDAVDNLRINRGWTIVY